MNIRKALYIGITILLFAVIIYFLMINRAIIMEKIIHRPRLVLWIALLFSLSRILEGYKFQIASSPLGLRLSFSEIMAVAFCVPMYNVFMPYGGIVTNMAYLKKERDFSATNFLMVSTVKLLTATLVNCIAGIAVLWFVFFRRGEYFGRYFFAIYIMIAIMVFILFLLPRRGVAGSGRWHRILNSAIEAWDVLIRRRGLLYLMLILQGASLLLITYRYVLVFRLLSVDVTYMGMLAVIPATNLLNSFNIIPGNLGLRELVLSLSVRMLGFDLVKGALSSMVDRIILTVVTLIIGGYLHLRLGHKIVTQKARGSYDK